MSYISAAAFNRSTPAPTPAPKPPIDAFTLPVDIPDVAEAHPGATSVSCARASLAPLPQAGGDGGGPDAGIPSEAPHSNASWGNPSEDWRARGLAHPAGRGWEVVTSASPGSPAPSTGPAAALLAQPEEARGVFTRERQVAFLSALAECGSVRAAASRSGVNYRTAYRARRGSPAFRQAWDGALLAARAVSEDVLATRAIDGVEEVVWFRGEEVGRRVRYDSRLLLAHLARLDKLTERARTRAFADDCEGALERFAAGIDDPAPVCEGCGEALPVASSAPGEGEQSSGAARFSPGPCDSCDTAPKAEAPAAAVAPVGEAAADEAAHADAEPLVWCPFEREMVDPDTARLNQMDAERPEHMLAPHELEGVDPEEVECAQMAAFAGGEYSWYLALPPENYAHGDYRIAAMEEFLRPDHSGGQGGQALGPGHAAPSGSAPRVRTTS